ncbi:hypothetical protein RQP46_003419 [Phenoliferia psychrophenolica]
MSTPPTPPRASLITLPTEIKAKIVEMAHLQQEAWKERDPAGFRTAFETDDAETRSRWHPLSLVNKEFRELAAPYLFQVLNSRRTLHPTFQCLVVPNHFHRIARVELRAENLPGDGPLGYTATLLPTLPALRSVSITYDAACELFGDVLSESAPTEMQKMRLASFKWYGSKLTRLELDWTGPAVAATVLRSCPGLQSLKYKEYTFDKDGAIDYEDEIQFLCALSSLANLESLTLVSDDGGLPEAWTPDWWDKLRWTPPPLKHLKLWIYHNKEVSTFIGLFAKTLQSLSLTDVDAASMGAPVVLPLLSTLCVNGALDDIEEALLLRTFQGSPLLSLTYSTSHDTPIESNTALQNFLSHHPHLREINLVGLRKKRTRTAPSDLNAYRSFVRSRGLEADFEDLEHNPFAPRANLEYGEDEIEYLAEALDRSLYFGRQDVQRMVRDKDVAKATPPRASLTTLPTEIKAKIVEMAYLQQEAWKERDPAGFRTAFETDDAETRSRWHPLSLVSKEFRELAAPHIFSVSSLCPGLQCTG